MSKHDVHFPETLREAVLYFADRDRSHEFMTVLRWPDGVVRCPCCGSNNASFLATRRVWKCRDCQKQFSVKVGTIFEDSPLSLEKWLPAVWSIVNAKNGISSCELARALGVTQKTAWFMLHRIRLALQEGFTVRDKFGSVTEIDESYIGGAARNMHKSRVREMRLANKMGTGGVGKTAVMGLLERGNKAKASRVRAEVLPNTNADAKELVPRVRKYVLKGSEVHTDQHRGYSALASEYTHKVINHAECYVKDGVTTNGLENFWSLLKRTIKGTYVSVEPFHLFRYLSEQCFRFNERKDKEGDKGRFLTACVGIIGRRLTYKQLIGDDAADAPATAAI